MLQELKRLKLCILSNYDIVWCSRFTEPELVVEKNLLSNSLLSFPREWWKSWTSWYLWLWLLRPYSQFFARYAQIYVMSRVKRESTRTQVLFVRNPNILNLKSDSLIFETLGARFTKFLKLSAMGYVSSNVKQYNNKIYPILSKDEAYMWYNIITYYFS